MSISQDVIVITWSLFFDTKLDTVQHKLGRSRLPDKSDEVFMDELILRFLG